jgi:signal transduction histidine kinase
VLLNKLIILKFYWFFFISICICCSLNSQTEDEFRQIQDLRLQSKNQKDYDSKLRLAKEAYALSEKLGIDSTIVKSNKALSNIYLNFGKIKEFGEVNKENLKLVYKLKDSTSLAIIHESLGYYFLEIPKNDSAYFHYYNSLKFYQKQNKQKQQANVLLTMATIQETERAYIGAEQNAIKGLKVAEKLPKNEGNVETLFWLYNLLAVIEQRQGNFEEAISYYDKAVFAIDNSKFKDFYRIQIDNNKANALEQAGNYEEALKIYRSLADKVDLKEIDPELYIKVNGNIAHTRFLLGDENINEIKSKFLDAYNYGLENKEEIGLYGIGNYISEFYLAQNKLDSAKLFANQTLSLAKKANSYVEILKSLELLSKIEKGEAGKQYLYEHIKLNDSLLNRERYSRNKFAKIEYETEQLKAENEQISKERLIFLISSVSLAVLLFLIYIVVNQRMKNKELRFVHQQQKANEEIYNLMLAQQDKVEEGRTKEKKRISEELHDGILGKLFGTRLSLDSLNLVNTPEATKSRSDYINELKNIETEIRKISHDLNSDFISDSGFMDIIASLVENQTKAYGLTFDFEEHSLIDWDSLPNKTKIHIYRMLQETLQNIYKHAEATHVKIAFSRKKDVILLTIKDDGKGFNVNKARKGIGLKNIDSRVKDIGGRAEIVSKLNEGTTIDISIPNS